MWEISYQPLPIHPSSFRHTSELGSSVIHIRRSVLVSRFQNTIAPTKEKCDIMLPKRQCCKDSLAEMLNQKQE